MYTGYPDEWYPRLESLKALDHKVKLFCPGNHDFHVDIYGGVAKAELRRAGWTLVGLDRPFIEVQGLKIFAVPYVTGLEGWAFNTDEDWLYEHLNRLVEAYGVPDLMLTHAPMYQVLDAIEPTASSNKGQNHVGSMAFNYWFEKLKDKPKYWVHGHIHESYGNTEVDGCKFYNVAMCDADYQQENEVVKFETP